MNRYLGTHAPWVLLDGFPLLLNIACWVALLAIIVVLLRPRPSRTKPMGGGKIISASARQNRAYKRGGTILLLVGAASGFLPSLALLAGTGQVWSVNRVEPHTDVDASLLVHIPLAVMFAVLFALQLWSGGVGSRSKVHRIGGWIAVGCVLVGVSLAAGWVWTYFNDFVDGFTGGRARAGYYTVALGVGAAVNAVLLVVYARKRNFMVHKDYALMTLFWTLDPGVHRTFMWCMRLLYWECWAPENTAGLGIALAKLPANLALIVWAITMAVYAGRLNGIILWNVAGQFLLFNYGSFGLMQRSLGSGLATSVSLTTFVLGLIAVVVARQNGAIATR